MPAAAHPRSLIAVAAVAALVLSGCRSYSGPPPEPAAAVRTTTTTTAPSTTTTTTTVAATVPVPVAPGAVPAPPPPGLGRGASGAEVLALEQRLAALRYDVGPVDGNFDGTTGHAVMAFQKVSGMERTGRATPDVVTALATAALPGPMFAEGGGDRVEIDLKRQVLALWQGGQLVRTLSVSTGNNKRYCVDGSCAKAVTPGGSFKVLRKIKGLRVSRLGQLYNPLYFNGGIAIHGSNSVPAGPASHGCVRIPMSASRWFHDTVPIGTPVYVIGGSRAPVPFNEPLPGEEDPAATTTTAVATTVPPDTTTLPPTTAVTLLPTIPTTVPPTVPPTAPPTAPPTVPPVVP